MFLWHMCSRGCLAAFKMTLGRDGWERFFSLRVNGEQEDFFRRMEWRGDKKHPDALRDK